MNYQVLARKWRPQIFNEIEGQKHIVTALTNSILNKRIHHSFLFYGTRGTGKTSTARILAKTLNCTNKTTENPCRICQNCQDIENNKFFDLIEIDGASKTKVDDIKDILENIQYSPIQGKYKIYLIDEVHMLSKHSFNALLKYLDEPPQHIKFILATTNLDKIPQTIISRCLLFNFKPISQSTIYQTIKKILNKEEIIFENLAIKNIALYAKGSLRDGLNFTDHAIAMSQGNLTNDVILNITGNISDTKTMELLLSIINKDGMLLINSINSIATLQPNWERVLLNILKFLHHIAMVQLFDVTWKNNDLNKTEECTLITLSKTISPKIIRKYYQELIIGVKELKFAPTDQIGFEMSLLRIFDI
ncbi:MAG: DNA polymerase III subunit gamma/tau [Buchnera aphidicola (Eriosoma harunire)]